MARNLTTDDVVDTSTRPVASSLGATDSILTYDDTNKIIKKSAPSVLKTAIELDGVTSNVITGLINDINGLNNDIASLNNPTEQKIDNGYVTLPSGIILQWGFNAMSTNVIETIPFNITFPNKVFAVYSSSAEIIAGDLTNVAYKNGGSLTDFKLYARNGSDCYWFAIGW